VQRGLGDLGHELRGSMCREGLVLPCNSMSTVFSAGLKVCSKGARAASTSAKTKMTQIAEAGAESRVIRIGAENGERFIKDTGKFWMLSSEAT
jgi:hypothetical protein